MTTYRLYVKQLDISCWCEKKIIKMKKLDYKCQMGTDPYIKSVSKKKNNDLIHPLIIFNGVNPLTMWWWREIKETELDVGLALRQRAEFKIYISS